MTTETGNPSDVLAYALIFSGALLEGIHLPGVPLVAMGAVVFFIGQLRTRGELL
jgi:hypothetical protein